MSLTQKKRHISRNNRARKLIRDFFHFKEDCLNNNDLQVLNRTIAEISDIIEELQDEEFYPYFSIWNEDEKDFFGISNNDDEDFLDTEIVDQPHADAEPTTPEPVSDEIHLLSQHYIDALMGKSPKPRYNSLCNYF